MSSLIEFLEREIERGSFPGGSALVGSRDAVLEAAHAGDAAVAPERVAVTAETRYDLASLTKPLVTGALAAAAPELDLSCPPGRYFPPWKKTAYEGITLESLFTHTSGIPAWFPLYVRGEGAAAYRRALAEIEPEAKPGSTVIYSDLNFLVLGEVLETHFSAPLHRLHQDLVAGPAGSGAAFLPATARETAATEEGDATERAMTAALGLSYPHFATGVVWGEVHDGNARRRGGVAAHAGLFGTARDVWSLARAWLADPRPRFTEDRTPGLGEARGLSWQIKRGAGSAIPSMSDGSFGHTGFTGTSVWLDPEADRVYVLLTNRIHPRAAPGNFNEVRRRFHESARSI
jgi:CubicO group peptidase (beta-lactamase class C family)